MDFKKKGISPDVSNISPVEYHEIGATPRRRRRKSSKREHKNDVYTSTSSTPISYYSLQDQSYNNLDSPSGSYPCSQDIRPEVVWDYSSPKLANGAAKKELKLTVKEFLEKLNNSQPAEPNTQSKQMLLLENWINRCHSKKTFVNKTSIPIRKKQKSRQAVEKLKMFLDSMQRLSSEQELNKPNTQDHNCDKTPENNQSKLNMTKDFIGNNSSDNDSTEELWGDNDYSFMVKATQELESAEQMAMSNVGVPSTIPETVPCHKPSEFELSQKEFTSRTELSDKCIKILTQLSNVDWSSDMESDEWEDGFFAEESMVTQESDKNTYSTCDANKETLHESESQRDSPYNAGVGNDITSSAALFDSFGSDNFEDDALFLEPDVLTQINEIESQYSQPPKCSPEEIKRKKNEALKRRQKNLK